MKRQQQFLGALLLHRREMLLMRVAQRSEEHDVGEIIRSSRAISPGCEIPASISANRSSPSIISSDNAAPSCEL